METYRLSINGVKLSHVFQLNESVKRDHGEARFSLPISRSNGKLQYIAFRVDGNEADAKILERELLRMRQSKIEVEYENGERYFLWTSVDYYQMEVDGEKIAVMQFAVDKISGAN